MSLRDFDPKWIRLLKERVYRSDKDPGSITSPKFASITCPNCGMTSYNPNDIREGYCGNCDDWTAKR